jgi:hemolysin activation/secretion protein
MTVRPGRPSCLRRLLLAALVGAGGAAVAADTGYAQDDCPFVETPGAPIVEDIVFRPESHYLDAAALAALAASARGCALGPDGRRALAEAVNALYAERDVALAFARVPEPPADPSRPLVELVEIRYGDVTVEGAEDTSQAFFRQRIGELAGRIADLQTLQDRLEALAELEGLVVQADIAPGDETGETDLTLRVTEEPDPWVRVLVLSNDGAETTGVFEGSATLVRRSLTGHRDPLTISASGSRGARSLLLGYSRPFGGAGVRISNNLGLETTRVIDEDSPVEGLKVQTISLNSAATWPLYADRSGSASLSLEAAPYIESIELQDVLLLDERGVEISAGGRLLVRFLGWGAVSFSPRLARGAYRDTVFATSENYVRFAGSAQGFVQVLGRVGLLGEASWQMATDPPPSNFAFDVTGTQTVRGYPTEAVSSDEGYVFRATVEDTQGIAIALGAGEATLSPFAFADTGAGWDKGGQTATQGKVLASTGFGANLEFDFGEARASFNVTVGVPLVTVPDVVEAGDPDMIAQFRLTF